MIHAATLLGFVLLGSSLPADGAARPAAESGLKVVVDPATGKIVMQPTGADLEALTAGAEHLRRRSSWELEEFDLATGGKGVFLDGWADHELAIVRSGSGELGVACTREDGPSPDGDGTEARKRTVRKKRSGKAEPAEALR